ncbi:MAG: glycosyltransferase, partial [Lachnospiraceae bacterium]|nr:glycosyltransferase [Lachnospiraceae bacterium]
MEKTGQNEDINYREEYVKEHLRNADLAGRVADLEAKCDDLTFKLNRIKNNPLWKLSSPLRKAMHFFLRQRTRLKNCGNLRGVIEKLKYKKIERQAMERYGTKSFPTPEEAAKQREAEFPRMVKISILVPLYNTAEEFLREMIESVTAQTYENWELCLADGSDEAHPEVAQIVREYQEKDGKGRIVYKKLDKNEGISGNTNHCLTLATGEYIGLFDHDDILHPSALYEYAKVINEKGADYIYCDETTFKSGDINKMLTMHFKPDYAIDNLRANNYICHFSMFDRKLLE